MANKTLTSRWQGPCIFAWLACLFSTSPVPVRAQDAELATKALGIFTESCATAGCHAGPSPAGNLTLEATNATAALVNQPSDGNPRYRLIVPGRPEKSYLMAKLVGSSNMKGRIMPSGGERLSKSELRTLIKWIKSMPASKPTFTSRAVSAASALPADLPLPRRKRYDPAFPGWSTANLPTPETVPDGGFMYRIAHKFAGAVTNGVDQFFGLDNGAFMMTQVAFPIKSGLSLSIQRAAQDATFEIGTKLKLFGGDRRQQNPFAAAFYGGVDWSSTANIADPLNANQNLGRLDPQRFAYFAQVSLSKKQGAASLLVTPGVLFNGNPRAIGEAPLLTVGVAGRYRLGKRYAFFAEYIPVLSGLADAATVNAFAGRVFESVTAGFEVALGGHVFHVFATNTAGNTTNQYLSGGEFGFFEGDMRIGFNVYRQLNYPF